MAVEVGNDPKWPPEPQRHLNSTTVNSSTSLRRVVVLYCRVCSIGEEVAIATGTHRGRQMVAHQSLDSPRAPPIEDDHGCGVNAFFSPKITIMAALSSMRGYREIAGDLTMSIMESHSPGASLLVVVRFVSVISCDVIIARLVANYRV
ncbi:hypothetical protein Sjap_007825 [Stephania japonica]|uniref:Uncharacterized protein n=1 Tax=Stephania japonica TaxID=461633 RepID=A0AAP0PDW8_9MAGN